MRVNLFIPLIAFWFLSVGNVCSETKYNELINIAKVKGKNYYHIKFELNNNNFQLNTKYGFNEGGMFELFINKSNFPIPAPNCKNKIILRMPWTDDRNNRAVQFIQEKKDLFEKLNNIGNQKISVVIELNPYIKVLDSNIPKVELRKCNVFFRHAGDRYIPKL